MKIPVQILTGEQSQTHYSENWKFGVLPDDNVLGDTVDGIIPRGEEL